MFVPQFVSVHVVDVQMLHWISTVKFRPAGETS